ncbi:MAG: hypothetical protein Q8L37_07525 [Candidatus Gottesmanbacteria bacterium]|nr:hypothetical protein [Candidatus Gottesmanbacteria bacterium]
MKNNPQIVPPVNPKVPLSLEAVVPVEDVPSSKSKHALWYVGGAIVVLLLFGLFYTTLQKSKLTPPQKAVAPQPTYSLKPTLARSKAPGIIVSIVTAKGIDPKTGEAVNPTTTFLTTEKRIYAVTTLQNAKVGTKIEYVRYLNDKFLDNRSITISKPNTNNTSFVWSLKNSTSARLVGEYKVKLYTNGIFEKETFFTVR